MTLNTMTFDQISAIIKMRQAALDAYDACLGGKPNDDWTRLDHCMETEFHMLWDYWNDRLGAAIPACTAGVDALMQVFRQDSSYYAPNEFQVVLLTNAMEGLRRLTSEKEKKAA